MTGVYASLVRTTQRAKSKTRHPRRAHGGTVPPVLQIPNGHPSLISWFQSSGGAQIYCWYQLEASIARRQVKKKRQIYCWYKLGTSICTERSIGEKNRGGGRDRKDRQNPCKPKQES